MTTLSKADEKQLYSDFLATLPVESYIANVLSESREFVFRNIDDDIIWPLSDHARTIDNEIRHSQRQHKVVMDELDRDTLRLQKIQREVEAAKRERDEILNSAVAFLDATSEARRAIQREISKS